MVSHLRREHHDVIISYINESCYIFVCVYFICLYNRNWDRRLDDDDDDDDGGYMLIQLTLFFGKYLDIWTSVNDVHVAFSSTLSSYILYFWWNWMQKQFFFSRCWWYFEHVMIIKFFFHSVNIVVYLVWDTIIIKISIRNLHIRTHTTHTI